MIFPAGLLRLAEDGTGPILFEIFRPPDAWPSLSVSEP